MEYQSGDMGRSLRSVAYQRAADLFEKEELRGGAVTRVLRDLGSGSSLEEIAPEDLDKALDWLRAWGSLGAALEAFLEELDPELISGEFHEAKDPIGIVLSNAHERIATYRGENW